MSQCPHRQYDIIIKLHSNPGHNHIADKAKSAVCLPAGVSCSQVLQTDGSEADYR